MRRAVIALSAAALMVCPVVASAAPLEIPAGDATVASPWAGKEEAMVGHSFTVANGADNGSVWFQDKDSYQPSTTGGSNMCFRSYHAAGVQAAQQLGMSLVDAACAGATPENVYTTPQYDEGVQTDWLTPDVDAVVMGGRGNPWFSKIIAKIVDPTQDPLVKCPLAPADCAAHMFDEELQAYQNETVLEQQEYDAIKAKSPHAEIFVLGFPEGITPKPGDDLTPCGWFFSPYEVAPVRNVVTSLNAMMRELADKNGAVFVDMSAPGSPWLAGRHDICAPYPDAWLWGPRLLVPPNDAELANPEMWMTASFHPTIPANNAMAAVLVQAMLDNPPNK